MWIGAIAAGVVLVAVSLRCAGTSIDATAPGASAGVAATGHGPEGYISAPPVEAAVSREGIQAPPTPTPNMLTPNYPLATPVPSKTPRPG